MGSHLCSNEDAGAQFTAKGWQQSLAQAVAAWAASQAGSSSMWDKQHGSHQQNGLRPQVQDQACSRYCPAPSIRLMSLSAVS